MEIVEQPLCRRRNEFFAVHRVSQDLVGLAEHPGVVVETAEEAPVTDLGLSGEGKASGEGAGPLFEARDAEQFGAERFFDAAVPTAAEPAVGRNPCVRHELATIYTSTSRQLRLRSIPSPGRRPSKS